MLLCHYHFKILVIGLSLILDCMKWRQAAAPIKLEIRNAGWVEVKK